MKKLLGLPLFCILTLACSSLNLKRTPATSAPFPPVEAGSLFSSYEALDIELDAPLAKLFAQKNTTPFPANKNISVDGVLTYTNDGNQKIQIPVAVHMKGFSTMFSCPFTKLELKMKSKNRESTLFASMKSVDLNTHCQEPSGSTNPNDMMKASFYNHREALIYRMAEILEIPTLKARPVFVRYKNTQIPSVDQKPEAYRAFFLEDMGSFRKRLNAKEIKGVDDPMKNFELALDPSKSSQYIFTDVKSSPRIGAEDASRIALFQAMLGNQDWFIKMNALHSRFEDRKEKEEEEDKTNLWNTKIAELPDGKWVLFPQDFSLSGILLGLSWYKLDKVVFAFSSEATQQRLKQSFLDKKAEIYGLTNTLTKDPEGAGLMKKTLDNFYLTLEAKP